MGSMYDSVVSVISKPPEQRTAPEVQSLMFWFRRRSQLFKTLKIDVLADIIRNCEFATKTTDQVIIKQGDMGNCFYIILKGTVSIYISQNISDMDEEEENAEGEKLNTAYTEQGKLDRSKFGNYIAVLDAGFSFGELALINKNCIRNASIITDETTDLLVVNRELYNRCLKAAQTAELEEKLNFVSSHPLFRYWGVRHKKQMSYSLRKEKISFNEHIVKQGEPASNIYFLLNGSARLFIEPCSHETQYPQFYPLEDPDDILTREELQTENHYTSVSSKKKDSPASLLPENQVTLSPSEIRRKEKSTKKTVEMCTITGIEIVGDTEFLLDLKTYLQNVLCGQTCDVYALDIKNYERLMVKKNPKSLELLRDLAEIKLFCRLARLHNDEVPLLRTLLFKLESTHRRKPVQKGSSSKTGEIRAGAFEDSMMYHRTPRSKHPHYSFLHDSEQALRLGLLTSMARHKERLQQNRNQPQHDSAENESPFITRHGPYTHYEGEEKKKVEYIDWASSDGVLSILEERIKEWHTSMAEDGYKRAVPGRRESLSPIRLKRFTNKAGQEVKPGTKIVVRKKSNKFDDAIPRILAQNDDDNKATLHGSLESIHCLPNDGSSPRRQAEEPGRPHKYSEEEYKKLKKHLRTRQRQYNGCIGKV